MDSKLNQLKGLMKKLVPRQLRKSCYFVSRCGADVYQLFKSLCSPETVDAKPFEEVKNLLINHLETQPTKFAQRYKFHSIVQTEGQSASDFISKLRTVGADCEFSFIGWFKRFFYLILVYPRTSQQPQSCIKYTSQET